MRKKILFVSYGGGHITIINKIAQSFIDDKNIEIIVIPFNGAISFVSQNLPETVCYPLSKFASLFDEEIDAIFKYGNMLLSENYNPAIGISKFESIFYLGLSYNDLVKQFGEDKAMEEYGKRKRQAFLPIGVMEVIINEIKPDIVITTASPRFEVATILAAKKLGIPSLQLLDSFGDDYPIPSADHIVVMNDKVENKLRANGVKNSKFYSYGQPILDDTIEKVNSINADELKFRLKLSGKKILLFGPHRNFLFNEDLSVKAELDGYEIHKKIFEILDEVANLENIHILVRPHPSDHINNYITHFQGKAHYSYFPELNVHEAIAISDYSMSYCSTIVLQALVCDKLSFTFNQNPHLKYPWEGYASSPFIYSLDFDTLKANLLQHISKETKVTLANFFEKGAIKKINCLVKELVKSNG